MRQSGTTVPVRLISLVLIIGAIIGIGVMLGTFIRNLSEEAQISPAGWGFRLGLSGSFLTWIFDSLFVAVLGWTLWAGIELWNGTPRGLKWAKILMAAQVLSITIPGFTYHFQTLGLTLQLLSADTLRWNLKFGTYLTIYLSTAIHDFAFGLNVVAIVALVYLWHATRPKAARPQSGSNLGLI